MFSRKTTKLTSFGAAVLERAEPLVEQLDRPVVDVEIELEARAEQDVARVAVVGHARIAERADEDRVELAQQVVAVRRHRDAGLEVVVGAPRQVLEVERRPETSTDGLEHLHRFGGDLLADAVARDDGDPHGSPSARARNALILLSCGSGQMRE